MAGMWDGDAYLFFRFGAVLLSRSSCSCTGSVFTVSIFRFFGGLGFLLGLTGFFFVTFFAGGGGGGGGGEGARIGSASIGVDCVSESTSSSSLISPSSSSGVGCSCGGVRGCALVSDDEWSSCTGNTESRLWLSSSSLLILDGLLLEVSAKERRWSSNRRAAADGSYVSEITCVTWAVYSSLSSLSVREFFLGWEVFPRGEYVSIKESSCQSVGHTSTELPWTSVFSASASGRKGLNYLSSVRNKLEHCSSKRMNSEWVPSTVRRFLRVYVRTPDWIWNAVIDRVVLVLTSLEQELGLRLLTVQRI